MAETKHRRPLKELSRLASIIQDRLERGTLQPEDDGKYLAINVVSGDFEVDPDDYTAVTRLRARTPEGEIWIGCVGQATAYKIRRGR